MTIRFDEHALFQMEKRSIFQQDVEETICKPDQTEIGKARISYFKCLPGRRVSLRVVAPILDREYVLTAYFDRKKPCV